MSSRSCWLALGMTVVLVVALSGCGPGQRGRGLLIEGPLDHADVQMGPPPTPANVGGSGRSPVSSPVGAPGAPGAGGPASPGGSSESALGRSATATALNRPAGTAGVKWGPNHHVIVDLDLSGMVPSGQYPVGLFSARCGVAGRLLESFPAVAASAQGTSDQSVFSLTTTGAGIPGGSSVRLGSLGSTDASSALSCGTVGNAITQTGRATNVRMG